MPPSLLRLCRNGFALLIVSAAAQPLCADVEWRGTIIRNGAPTFALTDTTSGASKWVPMGGAFQTFQVASYDAERQLLVLTNGTARTELTLATSRIAAPVKSAQDDSGGLSGLPLAEALAKRGDTVMRDQLAQLRAAQLSRDEVGRRLADAERLAQGTQSGANRRVPPSAGRSGTPTPESARNDLRKEAQREDDEIAKLTAQIEKAAADRRVSVSTTTP